MKRSMNQDRQASMSEGSSQRDVLTLKAVATQSGGVVRTRVAAILPGLTHEEVLETAALYAQSAHAIINAGNADASSPCELWWVPGRVELGGKHTDYCGGKPLCLSQELAYWLSEFSQLLCLHREIAGRSGLQRACCGLHVSRG